MPFDLQYIFQEKFPQIFIEFIKSNNILKTSSVTIFLGCWIFEGGFIAADQSEITDLLKHSFCVCRIGYYKVFILCKVMKLVIKRQKRFRHVSIPP